MNAHATTALKDHLNIILVEDDDIDAKAVHRAFAKARIANPIIRLEDGVEALRFLRGETGTPPEHFVMLVDLNMPRMGGLKLIETIRADPSLRQTVIFVMTTSNDDRDRTAAYDQLIAGYIVKKNAGADFLSLVTTLEHYWRIVELPSIVPGGPV